MKKNEGYVQPAWTLTDPRASISVSPREWFEDSIEVRRDEHRRKRDRDEQEALEFRKMIDELG